VDKNTRNSIQRATQAGRALLERNFSEQLEGTFDILLDGAISEQPGSHLSDHQKVVREKLVATMAHKHSMGLTAEAAVQVYLREAAFTTLNRFVALKMLEARDLVQECVSRGQNSSGFKEYTALAPGIIVMEDNGYRLYIETLFDEIGQEVKVLFDRRDVASLLWPNRQALHDLLGILNETELSSIWAEDETIGWVYQYFNGDEERSQMREKSQAPRNSHELAVRNQFFTPRYVVRFLTDNTLGRIWCEMMQGKTKLAHLDYLVRQPNEFFLADGQSAPEPKIEGSELSREELLLQTVSVPFRAKKDPRDLRILDPACGSGHFLLYAFDLLALIYEEAWNDAGQVAFTETGLKLQDDYKNLHELRCAMPELILRYNLHGVDIDPRAAQIAAFALWMRAHRAYKQFNLDRAERSPITKTNIVVAEPMPGDAELVREFATSLKPAVLGDLFEKMVEEMKLAGELGTLLKIEEAIAEAVTTTREAFADRQNTLDKGFLPGFEPAQGGLDFSGINDDTFFDAAEAKIIAALAKFSDSAAGSAGVRRQLFADDAGQGVAFIELMRKRFDVLLCNPPFGRGTNNGHNYLKRVYPISKQDLYASFVERGGELLDEFGHLGVISSRTGFFNSSFRKWRQKFITENARLICCADLGMGVLDDAMVEVAAYCLTMHDGAKNRAPSVFFRAPAKSERSEWLRGKILETASSTGCPSDVYVAYTSLFGEIPNSAFGYWAGPKIRALFSIFDELEISGRSTKVGVQTSDDERFVRLWWEVPVEERAGSSPLWRTFSKGSASQAFLSPFSCVLKWGVNGAELKEFAETTPGTSHWSRNIRSIDYYFQPGLSWSMRSARFEPHVVPAGGIFSVSRYQAFMPSTEIWALLGFMNSRVCSLLLQLCCERFDHPKFVVGIVSKLPVPAISNDLSERLAGTAQEAYLNVLQSDTGIQTSHYFTRPRLNRHQGDTAYERALEFLNYEHARKEALSAALADLDSLAVRAYNLTDETIAEVHQLLPVKILPVTETPSEREIEICASELSADLFEWLVGVTFGRFQASGNSHETELRLRDVDPFEPLPLHAPGMFDGTESDLIINTPSGQTGIAVEDEGHELDLSTQCGTICNSPLLRGISLPWGEISQTLLQRKGGAAGWLSKSFFGRHLKLYSDVKRRAPIYWQLATPSSSYSVWCYYHRLNRDTFFRVANDCITPKLDHEERKLEVLRQENGPSLSSEHRKIIEAQETFVAELGALKTEVTRIMPLWNPNLNDGVIINFAPLWRLVPQHKEWQKECKKIWDKLVRGDYDWAHLAMHLWPERVVPKCKDDHSLAIAHGLEDDFWYEDDDGNWQNRHVGDDRVGELIGDRASAAVKAALKDLLEAPDATGQTRRKRTVRA
jgi:23S rRNA G2445 N2-methylase RlmL